MQASLKPRRATGILPVLSLAQQLNRAPAPCETINGEELAAGTSRNPKEGVR
jgi:hypothetical protein